MEHLSTPTLLVLALLLSNGTIAQEEKEPLHDPSTYSGLSFRSLGPAISSGRISAFAVNPEDHSTYYVASASGGVWKTTDGGVTYDPIFDQQGSYSIGTVTLAPGHPNIVWVGTGENNNQRSVNYGDGIYRSRDGGKSWEKMGLENSEHIGKIIVHPKDPDIVYVAAYGPLWSSGGDRGVYKTTNGGEDWERILHIDEHTGVADIAMDPENPEVLYAASHQRRRRTWTYIGGGPGSGLHKTENGGEDWRKIEKGLPKTQLGRIGLAVAPTKPSTVYAIVEASQGKDGFYRSTDKGESWERRSGHATSGNYYQEIMVDPNDADRVYAMNTFTHYTEDGGKSFQRLGRENRHVDDHALWIDPEDSEHLLIGGDGGIYESFDRGGDWQFKPNLPVTQFYKVAVDNDTPFYNIYGGTQDNNTIGGPSRTTSSAGIVNSDWFKVKGGDGFETQVDPKDPNIVYSQSQYGWLVRYDKRTGEKIGIKPRIGKDDSAQRWNWDAPLIISPHDHKRLYFASDRLWRSDDRGDSWETVSPDLSRDIDRNELEVMGRVWGVDAVEKNQSTSIYGTITALSESPLKEGLLYTGTDDGGVHVSTNGGEDWRSMTEFPGVPDMSYVDGIQASHHDTSTVYVAFNKHKSGDFEPYILKSTDAGRSWTKISQGLPDRGSVYSILEDPQNPELLFAGTEFGIFFSPDDGEHWTKLKSGIPTINVRDMEIQEREKDLVLGTFGRGFYVLDDITPLRKASKEKLEKEAHLFPADDAYLYNERHPFGYRGKGFQGASYFSAENPPLGPTFTYHLKEELLSPKEKRRQKEKELRKEGKDVHYPSLEALRKEERGSSPFLIFTVRDADGKVVRRLKRTPKKGIHRVHWDMRTPPRGPVKLKEREPSTPWASKERGYLVLPGTYSVSLSKYEDGEVEELAGPQEFELEPLHYPKLAEEDRKDVKAFQEKVAELRRAVDGANKYKGSLEERVAHLKKAVRETPDAELALMKQLDTIENALKDLHIALNGDPVRSKHEFEQKPSIARRVHNILWNLWHTHQGPTETQRSSYQLAADRFEEVLTGMREQRDRIRGIEDELENAGAPWTPGRFPEWERR